MRIGIIGSEAAKFTIETRNQAELIISELLESDPIVVSGRCHLGGIDVWAEELADLTGCQKMIFPPANRRWEPNGYKQRNIYIAAHSDEIHVITVKELPPTYKGMRFKDCYHCAARIVKAKKEYGVDSRCDLDHAIPLAQGFADSHVKSGACWTAWYAVEKLGKKAVWHIV